MVTGPAGADHGAAVVREPDRSGAAERIRFGLDWKYALSLEIDDPGIDHTVLSEFRTRVVEHDLEEKVLDQLLARLAERGLLGPGGKARTDSTHVIAAARNLNRLELAGESVRATLEALAVAAPDWLAATIDVPDWSARYTARVDSWRLPASKTKQTELALTYARDGYALIEAFSSHGRTQRLLSPTACRRCSGD